MTLVLQLLAKIWPYALAAAVGAAGAWEGKSVLDAKVLATTKAGYEKQLAVASSATAKANADALAKAQAQDTQIADLDSKLTQEEQAHEADSRKLTAALATGTQRVRVAVRNCTPSNASVTASASSVGYGAPATADLDPATASRVFGVVAVDQRQSDKLAALQAYVCTIRPDLEECASGSAK